MKEEKSIMHQKSEMFFEIIGWVRIMLSPLIIGAVLAAIVYTLFQNTAGIIIGVILIIAGFVIGIWLANRAWKKNGTMFFLSRTMATPELDKKDQDMDAI